jgi:hypothetical protein
VCSSLLVDELDEVGLRAATSVSLGLLAALGEELDVWVAGNALLLGCSLRILGFSVNLGNDNVGLVGKVFGDSFPDWCEVLAV